VVGAAVCVTVGDKVADEGTEIFDNVVGVLVDDVDSVMDGEVLRTDDG